MVYVKTTSGVTSVIDGDKIERIGDEYFVTRNTELIGVFDVGVIQFIYKTKTKGKTHEL